MSDEATTGAGTSAPVDLPRIVIDQGDPTPEEIATLLVVLVAASGGQAPVAAPARPGWTRKTRTFNAGAVRGAGWGGSL